MNKHAEYLDVKFESLMFNIEKHLSELKELKRDPNSMDAQEECLNTICRAIRSCKFHFYRVLQQYGAQYEDSAGHFVDLAYAAADLASHTQFLDVQNSLRRHAKEIEEARAEVIDVQ